MSGINFFVDPPQETTRQVGGTHYQHLSPPPFEVVRAWNLPHAEAEVLYHVIRHRNKNGAEDIKKAIHILEMLLAYCYPPAKTVAENEAEE